MLQGFIGRSLSAHIQIFNRNHKSKFTLNAKYAEVSIPQNRTSASSMISTSAFPLINHYVA